MSKTSPKTSSSKILSIVDKDSGFQFCTEDGAYTNVIANSLPYFAEKLDGIDESALLFHYPEDFQAWIRDVIGDNAIADRRVS